MSQARHGPLLRVQGLVRRYPGVLALGGIDLVGYEGEVLGVVGENGAGKSTLMKILAGVVRPCEGTLTLGGRPWTPASPRAAADGGVALVHQELCLAENLTAADNIALGREPRRFGFIARDAVDALAREALRQVGAKIDPGTIVEALSAGERQLVEIAKGLAGGARVMILDEPTSSLTVAESKALFDVIRSLRDGGVLVLYVSHRLGEIEELCDRVIVLRDGRNAGEFTAAELTRDKLVSAMVGRVIKRSTIAADSAPEPLARTNARLAVNGLRTPDWPAAPLEFSVAPGEFVGIAGLVGAGRTELLETLFGLRRQVGGEIQLDGTAFAPSSPRVAIARGLALVPENRKEHGLLLEQSIRENIALATLETRTSGVFIDGLRERAVADAHVERLNVRASSIDQVAGTLSGGNQQKVIVARWLETSPRLLLLDEPTRGVDVGAREELYEILEALSAEGLSVLFASSDLEELLRLSHRILVMHEGRIVGDVARADATEARIMELATGSARAAEVTA